MLLTHKIIQLSCDQLVHGGGSQKLLQPVQPLEGGGPVLEHDGQVRALPRGAQRDGLRVQTDGTLEITFLEQFIAMQLHLEGLLYVFLSHDF